MIITDYKFGSIIVDGEEYTHDVEVRSQTEEILPWERTKSHIIDIEDIERTLDQNPDLIIIGDGHSSVAKITDKAQKEIERKQIQLIIKATAEAVKDFNEEMAKREKRVIGLFHLTC